MKFCPKTQRNVHSVSTTAAKTSALNAAGVSKAASSTLALNATDAHTGGEKVFAKTAAISRAKLKAAPTKAVGFARNTL